MNTWKFNILYISISLWVTSSYAQVKVTYAEHIRPILQQHCTGCHRPNDIAPFSLQTYNDAAPRAGFIEHVTSTKYMPPWRADSSFSHFKNENYLSEQEIQLIKQWVADGRERGKLKKKEEKQFIEDKAVVPSNVNEVDRKRFSMQQAYQIPGDGKEQFRFFHIPFDNQDSLYVASIQFIPGNKKLVHHSRVMTDTTLSLVGLNGMSADDTATYKYQSKPLSDPFLFGWVPGNDRIRFPSNTSKVFYPHTDLLLNIHYAPSPILDKDSSMVEIEFLKIPQQREIQTITITEDYISNQPFFIKSNQVKKFYMKGK